MGVPLDFDQDSPRAILDEAAKFKAICQTVHKGPKSDALNDPLDGDRTAFHSANGLIPCWAVLPVFFPCELSNRLHDRARPCFGVPGATATLSYIEATRGSALRTCSFP